MMSYLHSKFHDNWISSFRGVAMTRFWDGRTDGRSDSTPRPAFAVGDAGKKHENKFRIRTVSSLVKINHCFVSKKVEYSLWFYKKLLNSKFPHVYR